MDRTYRIEAASVVSDIIDGEAVMLHRGTGDYFSTDGVGCLIWRWIGEGHGHDRMVGDLDAQFAADPAEIAAAVESFIADLLSHGLIRYDGESVEGAAEAPLEAAASLEEFVRPVLNVYSDVRNLLLLDPIHDVAEETGWPMRKQTGTAT